MSEKQFNLIRDHVPFSQRGGLGKAHQLFGGQLSQILDELNQELAA